MSEIETNNEVVEKNPNTCFIEGTLKRAFVQDAKDKEGVIVGHTSIIILYPENLTIDGKTGASVWKVFDAFYDGKPAKYIPKWYKEKSGVVLKSAYSVPVRIEDSKEDFSFAEFVDRGLIDNAKVKIKCNIKESAFYPSAMLVREDGEVYDAFEGF